MAEDALDRFERLFRAAQLHDPAERAAFLDAACADDPALRRDLESLLAAGDVADYEAFLEAPAAAVADLLEPQPEEDPLLGKAIGPYTVLRSLGHGGMGDVYLARRDEPFRRYVALKVIRRGTDTREVLARFEMERQILAALDHPNIARLLDGGMTDDGAGPDRAGLPYFAMEYIEGRPLTAYCDEQRVPVEGRLRLFAQVCEAVHYAHQNLILHRDLKPTNILVTNRGEVKLLDFGVAKLLNPQLSRLPVPVTRAEQRVMTPEYASPEQVRGEILTTASDIYSLGVLLYELLVGRPPYRIEERTTAAVVRAVCEQEPPRPSTVARRTDTTPESDPHTAEAIAAARASTPERLRRHLRGDLDNIVLMALRKEPGRRYASAEQFAEDVGRYLEGRPVLAHRDARLYRLGKFMRRNRAVSLLVGLVTLSVFGGLAAALWLADDARRERDRAEAALAESEQVRAFLVDLFRVSDPRESRGATMTVTELLEHGVAQAERFDAQPLLQAEVFEAVGEVYHARGEYARAEALLRQALTLRRAAPDAQPPQVAESMLVLAHALRGRGRYADAEDLYRQALTLQQQYYGAGHPVVARTLDHLGGVRTYQGDLVGAEALYRQALALRQAVLPPEDLSIAENLRLIAVTLRRRGAAEDAAAYYREALALLQRYYGPDRVEASWGMLHLGDQYVTMGRTAEAEALFRRALQSLRHAEGDDPQNLVHGLHSLASLLQQQRQFDEAEALWREALALTRRLYGERSWRAAAETVSLANHFRLRGQLDEAEALLHEAIALYDEVSHPAQRYAMAARASLAQVYEKRSDYPRAETIYRELLTLREQAEGEGSMMTATDRMRLANVLALQGQYAEADTLYHQALRILQPQIADAHTDIQNILRHIVALYERQGRFGDAIPYRQRLVASDQVAE